MKRAIFCFLRFAESMSSQRCKNYYFNKNVSQIGIRTSLSFFFKTKRSLYFIVTIYKRQKSLGSYFYFTKESLLLLRHTEEVCSMCIFIVEKKSTQIFRDIFRNPTKAHAVVILFQKITSDTKYLMR